VTTSRERTVFEAPVATKEELAEYYRIPRELSYYAELNGETIPRKNLDFRFRLEAIVRALPIPTDKPVRMLDVGTGSGLIALHITAHHPNVTLTALDFNAKQLAAARDMAAKLRVGSRTSFVAADADRLPVRGEFDIILCTEVLEHLPEAPAVVERLAKLLAPGGRLLVTVPQVTPNNPGDHLYVGVGRDERVLIETHDPALVPADLKVLRFWHRLFARSEIEDLLVRSGLVVERTGGINWRFPKTFPFISFGVRQVIRSSRVDQAINRATGQRQAGNLVLVARRH